MEGYVFVDFVMGSVDGCFKVIMIINYLKKFFMRKKNGYVNGCFRAIVNKL